MRLSIGILGLGLLCPLPALAHHEALFGSQSSIVLSSDRYATAQVYTRARGPKDDRTRETTTVLSGGFSPFRGPVSISVVVPFSVISSAGQSQTGIENAVFGARYRQDLQGLTRAWSGKGAYVMGAGGIEVPTGTVDRSFGEGAPALVSAGLFSFEKGAFSIISYGFFHRYGVYEGVRDSGHVFVGTGVAWTPLALHPTAIVAAGKHALVFVVTSINVGEQWRDPLEHENFRLGVGTILKLGR